MTDFRVFALRQNTNTSNKLKKWQPWIYKATLCLFQGTNFRVVNTWNNSIMLRKHLTLLVQLTKCYHLANFRLNAWGLVRKRKVKRCYNVQAHIFDDWELLEKGTFSRGAEETFLYYVVLQSDTFPPTPFSVHSSLILTFLFSLYFAV